MQYAVSPRRNRSGDSQRRSARHQRRTLHELPRRTTIRWSIKRSACRVGGRIHVEKKFRGMQTKQTHTERERWYRGSNRRGAHAITPTFQNVTGSGIACTTRTLATRVVIRMLFLRRKQPRRFQHAMLCRRQPESHQQECSNFADQRHSAAKRATNLTLSTVRVRTRIIACERKLA